jgi:hypothetical protein
MSSEPFSDSGYATPMPYSSYDTPYSGGYEPTYEGGNNLSQAETKVSHQPRFGYMPLGGGGSAGPASPTASNVYTAFGDTAGTTTSTQPRGIFGLPMLAALGPLAALVGKAVRKQNENQ